MQERTYIAIDLKSFYASAECVERGCDPLTTNLVVADASRSEKTICLAVSPSLKSFGIPGRPRLFEVVSRVAAINRERSRNARRLSGTGEGRAGKSMYLPELERNPALLVDYIVAQPRMRLYITYSTRIYQVYLRHFSADDIHVYSIDEVFIDATDYLRFYGMTAHELAMTVIRDILATTGITATCGIGTNMYLCKVAMDIVAKKMPPDRDGVRIAELDEQSYRRQLWEHTPITDFWRVGQGYARRLRQLGLNTMGDVALASLRCEDLLYRTFGVSAELLIDHAWGWEPCTIRDVKQYAPRSRSIGSGQVLSAPSSFSRALLVAQEMADALALDLVARGLVTAQLVVTVGYDASSLAGNAPGYTGAVGYDHYGRKVPKHAHGTINFPDFSSSSKLFMDRVARFFETHVDPGLLVRRLSLTATRLLTEQEHAGRRERENSLLDLLDEHIEERERALKENRQQKAILAIQSKYGKNALMRGLNLKEGATARERNGYIGGHKA